MITGGISVSLVALSPGSLAARRFRDSYCLMAHRSYGPKLSHLDKMHDMFTENYPIRVSLS